MSPDSVIYSTDPPDRAGAFGQIRIRDWRPPGFGMLTVSFVDRESDMDEKSGVRAIPTEMLVRVRDWMIGWAMYADVHKWPSLLAEILWGLVDKMTLSLDVALQRRT
jgi:hypothetical protein